MPQKSAFWGKNPKNFNKPPPKKPSNFYKPPVYYRHGYGKCHCATIWAFKAYKVIILLIYFNMTWKHTCILSTQRVYIQKHLWNICIFRLKTVIRDLILSNITYMYILKHLEKNSISKTIFKKRVYPNTSLINMFIQSNL